MLGNNVLGESPKAVKKTLFRLGSCFSRDPIFRPTAGVRSFKGIVAPVVIVPN